MCIITEDTALSAIIIFFEKIMVTNLRKCVILVNIMNFTEVLQIGKDISAVFFK